MGEPAVPLNGHAPFARGPTKVRGVRLDRIPRPGAATRLCLDHRSPSKLSSLPPLSWRRALQGGDLDAPLMERREASRPVGRLDRITLPPPRLTTGCVLDPCSLAYSLLGPHTVPPKVGPVRGWTTGLPASDRNPTGPRLGRWTDYCGPAKAGSGRDRQRGKSRKGGAGGPGSGRRPAPAGRSLERDPGTSRDAARSC